MRRRLLGTVLTRTVVLSAWMAPGVLVGIVWQMLLSSSQFGIVNYLLEKIGIGRATRCQMIPWSNAHCWENPQRRWLPVMVSLRRRFLCVRQQR